MYTIVSPMHPLPSSRQYLSSGDYLEDKTEDYQNYSVIYYV